MRLFITTLLYLLLTLTWSHSSMAIEANRLVVPKLQDPVDINAQWDKEPWLGIAAAELTNYMGDYPEHFPKVLFKVAYDDEALYIIWQVHDQYIVAVADQYQGAVYKDSCVEFFFTPDADVSLGYFNLEMNGGGTALFNFQPKPWTDQQQIAKSDFDKITIAHSLPRIVHPEIADTLTWTLEYRIPFSIIEKYAPTVRPAPGVVWRANFYKCADNSSHPHWLTWSPVEYSRPNFHLPQFFGYLEFGDRTDVGTRSDEQPSPLAIRAFPDPFNVQTTIQYHVTRPCDIRLDVANINGQVVKTLASGHHDAGTFNASFDASLLPSGVYICSLTDGNSQVNKRITLAK